MALDSGAAGAIAAAVAVPIVMKGLSRLFPPKDVPETVRSLEELEARYRRWELGLGFGPLLAAVPLGFALWAALRALAAAHARLLPDAEVRWETGAYYWAIPAIFLALVLAGNLSTFAARLLLRDRYPEYLAYQQFKHGMDLLRVGRWLTTGVALACAVFVFMGLDWSVRLEQDALVVNGYLSVGDERHPLAGIRAIRTAPVLVAPNGNLVSRREWVVRFADDRTWTTNNSLAEASEAEKRRLVTLLAERSGVRIEEARVLRREEL
ncbi:MAG TPA: hypothetical protein VLT47_08670 [Anaeromyxobacteraceae bacterium]|nr:hypothetical protein [Anaeromyxobacteraceae bacterium]